MKCVSPITIGKRNGKGVHVPCGTCLPCLRNKRRDWYFRLQQEQKHSTNSYFLTLTYEEEEMPKIEGVPTLLKADVQKFINSMRKAQERLWKKEIEKLENTAFIEKYITGRWKIRYFAVGEYGTKGDRPHYHICIFNVVPLVLDRVNEIWKKGFVHVGEVNFKSMKYATKYIIGGQEHFTLNEKDGRGSAKRETGSRSGKPNKPFSLMSHGDNETTGGIGYQYLTPQIIKHHREKAKNAKEEGQDYFPLVRSEEGYEMKMPMYYRNKIFQDDYKEYFQNSMLRIGDKIENDQWEEMYKIAGDQAEARTIERFENLNRRMLKRLKQQSKL